jgi:hypothetical protein
MIPPLTAEIKIIFYLFLYGIFLMSAYDIVLFVTQKAGKFIRIVGQSALFILLVFITVRFTYSLHHGYIPWLFPVFLLGGGLIYLYLLKKQMLQELEQLAVLWGYLKKPVKKIVVYMLFPKEAWRILCYPFRKMKETLRLFFRKKTLKDGSD